ncbi:hypothetical protein ABIA39_002777 [Nocardia sp. GAS34]
MVCCLLLGGLMLLGPEVRNVWRTVRGRSASRPVRAVLAEVGVAPELVVSRVAEAL